MVLALPLWVRSLFRPPRQTRARAPNCEQLSSRLKVGLIRACGFVHCVDKALEQPPTNEAPSIRLCGCDPGKVSPRRACVVSPPAGHTFQRTGNPYWTPPFVHKAFSPRSILRGEPWPTLRSNTSL